MSKHLATEAPKLGNYRVSYAPRHRAETEEFTPIRDVWTTADDIKAQRREAGHRG